MESTIRWVEAAQGGREGMRKAYARDLQLELLGAAWAQPSPVAGGVVLTTSRILVRAADQGPGAV
jgi:hypothetical protein